MTKLSDVGETTGAAQDLRALLESGEGYRLLVDAVQDYAMFTMDPEGKVASWKRHLSFGMLRRRPQASTAAPSSSVS